MSPRRGKSPDRACSSTWSTRCCISKAIPAAGFACCARSRIASARRMRSACSPWWSRGCERSPIHPRYFSRATPSRFPGSVITVMREGTRSLLIEVQVLADASLGANPRRVAVGIDGNRLTMLLGGRPSPRRLAAAGPGCVRQRRRRRAARGNRRRSRDRARGPIELARCAGCRIR